MANRRGAARTTALELANVRTQRIYAVVDSIPRGCVASYGQVAREALLPGRARLVGRLMSGLSVSNELPWHRVVNAAGKSSLEPGRAAREQRRRLRLEGVEFSARGRIDLLRYGWRPA